jgi:hypothetical protein
VELQQQSVTNAAARTTTETNRDMDTPVLGSLPIQTPTVEERFLKPENRALALTRDKPAELLQALAEWRPVRVEKWPHFAHDSGSERNRPSSH